MERNAVITVLKAQFSDNEIACSLTVDRSFVVNDRKELEATERDLTPATKWKTHVLGSSTIRTQNFVQKSPEIIDKTSEINQSHCKGPLSFKVYDRKSCV